MNILACGGRTYTNKNKVYDVLDDCISCWDEVVLINGCAKGADTLAQEWAKDRGFPIEKYPALWDVHGKSAGYIRNKLMLDDGQPDLVVAFPGGKGTAMMVKIAEEANVEVIIINDR